MTGLKDFSTDAASNDVAAPPIFWGEGQSAGSVNNSSRAMMAALACWREDNNGRLVATRGANDVYAIGTNQGFTNGDGAQVHTVAFRVDAANQGPAKLSLDGLFAFDLRRQASLLPLAPGDLVPGPVYEATNLPDLNVYVLRSPTVAAPGKIVAYASQAAVPPGWLPCTGASVSRTVYVALFGAIGTTWGIGDGSTTFTLPNLQGRTLFGVDSNAGLLTGAGGLNPTIGAYGGSETVTLTADQLASHGHGGSIAAAGGHDHGGSVAAAGQHAHGAATDSAGGHTHSASTTTAGAHQHTGTTGTAGTHGHAITYSIGTAGSGATNRVVTDLQPNGSNNAGGATSGAGDHAHDFTTAGAGDHSHGVTVAAVADHAHVISADGQHQHGIAVVADHTHALSIAAAGSGAAHPNMPPGAVVVWAIKA